VLMAMPVSTTEIVPGVVEQVSKLGTGVKLNAIGSTTAATTRSPPTPTAVSA
jgi:hypothetical protein